MVVEKYFICNASRYDITFSLHKEPLIVSRSRDHGKRVIVAIDAFQTHFDTSCIPGEMTRTDCKIAHINWRTMDDHEEVIT